MPLSDPIYNGHVDSLPPKRAAISAILSGRKVPSVSGSISGELALVVSHPHRYMPPFLPHLPYPNRHELNADLVKENHKLWAVEQ